MSFTATVPLPTYPGASGITLRITAPGSSVRLNGSADDTMDDSASDGLFLATVTEDLVGIYTYSVRRAGAVIQAGWLKRVADQSSVQADDPRDCLADCGESQVVLPPILPSSSDALQNIRNNILNRIAEITAAPKPDYSVDGQSVSWGSYLDTLLKQLEAIDMRIALSQEPFEFVSRGIT